MRVMTICAAAATAVAAPASAMWQPTAQTMQGEMILYQAAAFDGEQLVVDVSRDRLWSDWTIRSLAIHPGDRWLVCDRSFFRGPCAVLDRSVADAATIGFGGRIRSVRRVTERRPVAAAAPSLIPSQPQRQPGT